MGDLRGGRPRIAYSTFRKGRRQLISSVFTPLLGKPRVEGPVGKLIDILALFATLFGSAASLGLGALQIRTGMVESGWIGGLGTAALVLIIVALTICLIASAVSGIARGIQYLANANMVLAALLALFVFLRWWRSSSCPARMPLPWSWARCRSAARSRRRGGW